VIKIGEGVQFCETSIYLHNGVEVVIERGVQCHENHICLYNEAKIIIEDGVELRENQITMNQFSKVAIARKAVLKKSHITIGKNPYFMTTMEDIYISRWRRGRNVILVFKENLLDQEAYFWEKIHC
jgi:hypothetical protein